jgi:hypothetical protein
MPGSLQPLCKQSLAVGQCMHPAWKVAGTHPLSDLSSLDSRPVALRQFHWSRKKVKSKGLPKQCSIMWCVAHRTCSVGLYLQPYANASCTLGPITILPHHTQVAQPGRTYYSSQGHARSLLPLPWFIAETMLCRAESRSFTGQM